MSERDDRQPSRRDFLKNAAALGLTTGLVGSGALALAGEHFGAPTAGGVYRRPWWIRQVDQPTTGVDWSRMQRFNANRDVMLGQGWRRALGEEEAARLGAIAAENERSRILADRPGYTLKDHALQSAFSSIDATVPRSFLPPANVKTPDDRGVPRWSGTKEEAAAMVKTAMYHMGAATVGIVQLDPETTEKLVYAVDPDGKELVFTDDAEASETETARYIPRSARWMIVYTVRMSPEAIRRAPTKIAEMSTEQSYQQGLVIQYNLQAFLRGIGYTGLGQSSQNALGIGPAFAVLGGLGELSRQNRMITPEYGPLVRVFLTLTDLPLATDSPIDAGIARFCRSCKKCAEACPPGALSFETEPGWVPVGYWNNVGHQAWFEDAPKCRRYWSEQAGSNCGICFAVCPFSKMDRSFMHRLVKMQVAAFPALDGMTRNMDDAFGYGVQKDPEAWWTLDLHNRP
jgi:reductive dehalogenase